MIPKIIHQVWIGPKTPPIKPMDTWKDKHPNFEYIRWNEEEFVKRDMEFECQNRIDEMTEINGKADIIRWEILYKYGGIFIDADSICIESIDVMLMNQKCFAGYEQEDLRPGLIATGTMGFPPKHPLVKDAIDFIKKNLIHTNKAWITVGPGLLTRLYDSGKFPDLTIFPSYTFLPIHHTNKEYQGHGKVYAYQLWGSTNFGNFDKSGSVPKQLLIGNDSVSILVSSYNTKAKYIKECLDSIKHQVGNINIELVWINDGSDELNTLLLKRLLDDFGKTTRFINVVYSENDGNKGIGFTLNKGVKLCSNEIIMRMDSDDIMVNYRIIKQLNFMKDNPECVLCGAQINMFKHVNNKLVDHGKTNHPNLDLDTFMKNTNNHWLMNHPTFCFRKQKILEVGNYNGSIHSMCEDFELILRVFKKYDKIHNMKDVLLYYRLHEGQLTYNGGKEGSRYWTDKRNELINDILSNENKITLSTCFYILNSKFDIETYKKWAKNLIDNVNNFYLVIYTDNNSKHFFDNMHINNNIKLIIKEINLFNTYKYNWIKNHEQNTLLNSKVDWKVNMLWNEKINFVNETINNKYFNTKYYGWCDIGYFRCNNNNLPFDKISNWPNNTIIEKLKDKIYYAQVCSEKYLNDIELYKKEKNEIPAEQCSIAGGFFISNKDNLKWWHELYYEKVEQYLNTNKLIKDDQIIIVDLYLENKDKFKLITQKNKHYDPWFAFDTYLL
jgi:glycosyltransferase involved in cell wall biosynthesis